MPLFEDMIAYQRYANREMILALGNISQAGREADRGSFFGSIDGLLKHLIRAQIFLMKNLFGIAGKKPDPVLERTIPDGGEALPDLLIELDEALAEIGNTFTEEDWTKSGTVTRSGGNRNQVSCDQLLLQILVHQTHHRGQVSQILDSLNIDHDFGGIWAVLTPNAGN